MKKKREILVSICALLIIVSGALSPSLENGFTNWDDDKYVTANTRIRDLSREKIRSILASSHQGLYKPITELSFSLEYHFFGLNPFAYHTTNLCLHLLNCLLVFWLVLILSGRAEVSFVAALLFGIHPLRVESVAWVSERKDMFYGFFSLGSLISYLYYLGKKSLKHYYLSIILFLFSLLSKPQGISLPLVLFLFDYFYGRSFNRGTFYEKAPFFLMAIIFATMAAVGQSSAGHLNKQDLIVSTDNLLNAGYGLVSYLAKLALPVKLSCFYPCPERREGMLPYLFSASFLVLTASTTVMIFSGRHGKKLIFAGFFFFIMVLPVLQIIPTGPAVFADRYTYIPSIGLSYLAGEGLFRLYREKTKRSKISRLLFLASLTIIIGLFSFLTWRRCRVWKNSQILWTDVLKKHDRVPLAHNNLGIFLAGENKMEEAIFHYNEALRLKPDDALAHNNLGLAWRDRGDLNKAIAHYLLALAIKPDYAEAHIHLGLALAGQGRFAEAVSHYKEALRLKPDLVKAHSNWGIALFKQDKIEEAVFHYREAIRIMPDFAEAHNNLGAALLKQGKIEEAVSHYTRAVRLMPQSAKAHLNLAFALEQQGKPGEASFYYSKASRLEPKLMGVVRNRELARPGSTGPSPRLPPGP